MAHLKHPEQGTEIEVDDNAVKAWVGDGWEAVGDDSGDKPAGRRKPSRKAADD